MRRIGATCAREGMVMGWPIYDSDGRLILDVGDELDAESLTRISESGIATSGRSRRGSARGTHCTPKTWRRWCNTSTA